MSIDSCETKRPSFVTLHCMDSQDSFNMTKSTALVGKNSGLRFVPKSTIFQYELQQQQTRIIMSHIYLDWCKL